MTPLSVASSRPLVILAYPRVEHEKDYVYHWMPFSLLTIAQRLLDDVDVLIFDGNQRSEVEWSRFLDAHLGRAICIGFSVMTGGEQIRHGLAMARQAKTHVQCPPLVFGGPHVNVLPEQTAEHELVDFALQGPGQSSMPAFVAAMRGHGRLADIPGLYMKRNGSLTVGPPNPPKVGMLGGYPWDLIDVNEYVRNDPTIAPRTLNYVSSQGCVYKCAFCYETTYRQAWSSMRPPTLAHDIESLVRRFDLSGIKFYDADFFVNPRRAVEFCDELKRRHLEVAWAASINPNDVLRAGKQGLDLLGSIASTHCRRLLMGMESGSDRVLREVVHKEITREQMFQVATEIAAHGIRGCYTFIVGFPGETDGEVEETYALLEAVRRLVPAPETRVHLFGPLPGTPLWKSALDHGFQAPTTFEGWSSFDYYETQTPWTSAATALRARLNTNLVLRPRVPSQAS